MPPLVKSPMKLHLTMLYCMEDSCDGIEHNRDNAVPVAFFPCRGNHLQIQYLILLGYYVICHSFQTKEYSNQWSFVYI